MRKTLILLFFLGWTAPVLSKPGFGLIQVPVTDLRSSSGSHATSLNYDPLQETQLLYNEPVQIFEKSGDWLRVEAIEQKEFTHNDKWQGYPGWVHEDAVLLVKKILPSNLVVQSKTTFLKRSPSQKSKGIPLSIGTKLVYTSGEGKNGFWKVKTPKGKKAWVLKKDVRLLMTPPEKFARKLILESGEKLLGDPYFWGGRSAKIDAPQVSAVDCSGFTNLAYRVAGMDIPRDSHEQFMASKKIKREELKPGDLIFTASKEKPNKVKHVTLFVDSNTILEAPKTGEVVRKIEFDEKYGPDAVLHFGTFFGKN